MKFIDRWTRSREEIELMRCEALQAREVSFAAAQQIAEYTSFDTVHSINRNDSTSVTIVSRKLDNGSWTFEEEPIELTEVYNDELEGCVSIW